MTGRRLAAGLVTSGTALLATSLVATGAAGLGWAETLETYTLTNLVIGAGLVGAGGVIGWHRPENRLGWLFLVGGLGHLASAAAAPLALAGLAAGWSPVVVRGLSSLFLGGWVLGVLGLFPLALLLFPDGRLPSPRWRPVAGLVLAMLGVQLAVELLGGAPALDRPGTESLLSAGLVLPDEAATALNGGNAAVAVAVVASTVLRYRRGTEQVRRQLLWLILAVLVLVVVNSQRWLTGEGPVLPLLTFVLVPAAIAIAVVRHSLLDIRFVLSRTVLYLGVSLVLLAGWAGLVAGVSLLVPDDADRAAAALAALAVAFAFAPARALAQRLVDQAFYGVRADALGAAEDAARQAAPGGDLAPVLERSRETLRLPALTLWQDGRPVLAAGQRDGGPTVRLPLAEGSPSQAELEVALRRGETTLHPDDRRVLTLVATPLALALHATHLADEVRASRAALVGAHAEERLRLHRELHDGLGPVLTGVAFRADAAGNVLRCDPDAAEKLIGEVRAEVRQAIDGVRRVVYGLRPAELEERGLVGALRHRLTASHPVEVELDVPDELGELPPAVEVAAFRVATEAVTNVLRHASATRCVVRLTVDGRCLRVEVTDDGNGGGDAWAPGVGLRSLVVRAEEIGGRASAGPTPAGGRVTVELPL